MKRLLILVGLMVLFALVASYIAFREPQSMAPPRPADSNATLTHLPDIAEPEHVAPQLPDAATETESDESAPAAALEAPEASDDDGLQPPAIIGRVIPPAGFEGARYDVRLMIERAGAWEEAHSRQTAPASIEWQFQFDSLAPGHYRVEAYMVVLRPVLADSTHVQLEGGVSQVALRLPPPLTRDFIVARVSGPAGPITSNVELSLRAAVLNRLGPTIYGPAFHRGSGEYWLARVESLFRHESEGWWEISVRAEGFAPRTVRYARDEYHVIQIVLDPPAYLIVEINGLDEHPERDRFRVSYAHVGPYLESLLARPARPEPPDTENRYGPIEPGEYVVALQVDGGGKFVDRRTVQIHTGENRVALAAPELYSFKVAVRDELDIGDVEVRRVDNFDFRVAVHRTGEGIGEVSGLYTGEHVIRHTDAGEMRISLPAVQGQEILFLPKPFNALRVSFRFVIGEANLPLEHGDVVVEIDGASLAEAPDALSIARASTEKPETKWVVVRHGAIKTLNLRGEDFRNKRLMFTPTCAD